MTNWIKNLTLKCLKYFKQTSDWMFVFKLLLIPNFFRKQFDINIMCYNLNACKSEQRIKDF